VAKFIRFRGDYINIDRLARIRVDKPNKKLILSQDVQETVKALLDLTKDKAKAILAHIKTNSQNIGPAADDDNDDG
jgi:hypothetical protein